MDDNSFEKLLNEDRQLDNLTLPASLQLSGNDDDSDVDSHYSVSSSTTETSGEDTDDSSLQSQPPLRKKKTGDASNSKISRSKIPDVSIG